jgi:hypothetical protein
MARKRINAKVYSTNRSHTDQSIPTYTVLMPHGSEFPKADFVVIKGMYRGQEISRLVQVSLEAASVTRTAFKG